MAFSPSDISNMELWLKADTGVYSDNGSTPATDTDAVYRWDDQSGNNRDVVQATEADRPTYNTSEYETLPAIAFSKSDKDWLRFAGADPADTISQPITFFVVAEHASTPSGTSQYTLGGSADSNRINVGGAYNNNWHLGAGTNLRGGSVDTDIHIFSYLAKGASSYLYIDGDSELSGNAGTGSWQLITIGGGKYSPPGSPFDGNVCEVIMYSAELSSGDRGQVEQYLGEKWLGWVASSNIKSWNGLAKASIKSINGLAIASIKNINGLT